MLIVGGYPVPATGHRKLPLAEGLNCCKLVEKDLSNNCQNQKMSDSASPLLGIYLIDTFCKNFQDIQTGIVTEA